MLRPPTRTTPDAWAAENRIYPKSSGMPGPRNPFLTPYAVPIGRAIHEGRHRRIVAVMGAQSGKSETFLDCLGARLDQRPAPILYVGPSKEFLTDQFEPRLMDLFDQAATLRAKVVRGRRMKKTRKLVAGVPVRLAHAGSSTALKSDPFALAFVDEYDEMLSNIKGQGDPLGLIEARGDTYADFCAAIISTCSRGLVETEIDPVSGLEFWKIADQDDLKSGIWRLWQEGTRFHWAWPCPHCSEYFIPRHKCLHGHEDVTPAKARRDAFLACPRCGCGIFDESKDDMNAKGLFVAPGQTITPEGEVVGDIPENSTLSFWVSGLASPFVSWGERAEKYVKALQTGEGDRIQTVINAGFGECYSDALGGDAPAWEEVRARAQPYKSGDVPAEVICAVAGVDVQKRSLYYVVRGFGSHATSWLLDHGQIHGDTDQDQVWDDLWELLQTQYDGVGIRIAFINSGFRPDAPENGDEHRVYAFCRKHPTVTRATKGHDTQSAPLLTRRVEITLKGAKAKGSLELVHIDTDHFKSLVHSRIKTPDGKPGAFYLPQDIDEDYCKQLTSEARALTPNGKRVWVRKSRNNHLLDAESMAAAAGHFLRVHNLREGMQRPRQLDSAPGALEPARTPSQQPQQQQPKRSGGWLDKRQGWLR